MCAMAQGQDHEVERLQEELRLMQKFYGESSGLVSMDSIHVANKRVSQLVNIQKGIYCISLDHSIIFQ